MFGHDESGDAIPPIAGLWPLGKLTAWLDATGSVIDIDTGSPRVRFGKAVAEATQEKVIRHLTYHKVGLLAWYFDTYKAARIPDDERPKRLPAGEIDRVTGEMPADKRKRLIAEAFAEAARARQPVWFLRRDGLACHPDEKPRRKLVGATLSKREVIVTIDAEATHVSVGAAGWVALPKITSRLVDDALTDRRDKRNRGH